MAATISSYGKKTIRIGLTQHLFKKSLYNLYDIRQISYCFKYLLGSNSLSNNFLSYEPTVSYCLGGLESISEADLQTFCIFRP